MNHFIPQMQPWFDDAESHAVQAYLQGGGWITEFKETLRFAGMIAEYTGARFCSVVSNGTVSLTAALLALDVGPGDEVIVPAYTMVASANAVRMACGATPVFVDVERDMLCMDAAKLTQAITRRTRAVMLVSINGRYPTGLASILEIASKNRLHVIEDAAQSLGSFHAGRHVGRFGIVGSFSFSMPKIISTGQGGALITDDESLFRKIELVRNFGRENAGVDKHVFFGGNFKFTDLQAVIGIEQMKKLASRVEIKKRNYRWLREHLGTVRQVQFLETAAGVAPWFNDVLVERRDELIAHLKGHGIGARPFYPAVPTQVPYSRRGAEYPVANEVSRRGLWLPSYGQLTDAELSRVAEGISSFYR